MIVPRAPQPLGITYSFDHISWSVGFQPAVTFGGVTYVAPVTVVASRHRVSPPQMYSETTISSVLPSLPDVALCAAENASSVSLAAGIKTATGAKHGVSGFLADAIGGKVISGASDLYQSFSAGSDGGRGGYSDIVQAGLAGPALGFGPAIAKFSPAAAEATAGLVDVAEAAVVGATYASGIGEGKLLYDGITYLGALAACASGK